MGNQDIFLADQDGYGTLNKFLEQQCFSKIIVLVDANTHQYCLSRFLSLLRSNVQIEVVEIAPGEDHKTMETCDGIWKSLSDLGCDRKSILINLGGGVVTDIGGFIGATFKRGISFINVPTTLLAMVDAAVGGKTGVNLGTLKNQIGVIKPADLILIDTHFLQTLSPREMRSGLAEMLKHGLIQDENYWRALTSLKDKTLEDLGDLILRSIDIKEEIVAQDPQEQNIRRSLNYGHTLGHAIESYFLEHPSKEKLLHGEAVALGMLLETYISNRLLEFPSSKLAEITQVLLSLYGKISLENEDQERIIELLQFDKKNEGGKVNFVLLKEIGQPEINCEVPEELLLESFTYYLKQE